MKRAGETTSCQPLRRQVSGGHPRVATTVSANELTALLGGLLPDMALTGGLSSRTLTCGSVANGNP